MEVLGMIPQPILLLLCCTIGTYVIFVGIHAGVWASKLIKYGPQASFRPRSPRTLRQRIENAPLQSYIGVGVLSGVVVGLIAFAFMSFHNSNLPHAQLQRFLSSRADQRQPSFHFAFPSVADDFLARFYFRHLCKRMRDLGLPLSYRFYLSSLNISGSSAFLSLVEEEAIAFGDLVFFANLTEEYSNLPQKIRYMFHSACRDLRFDFLVKMDSDLVARPADLALALMQNFQLPEEKGKEEKGISNSTQHPLIWAGKFLNATRYRDEKHDWFIPDHVWPLEKEVPTYPSGGLYLMSYELAKMLGEEKDLRSVLESRVEDAANSISIAKFPSVIRDRIQRVNIRLFGVTQLSPESWYCGREEKNSDASPTIDLPAVHFSTEEHYSTQQLCMEPQEKRCPHFRPGIEGLWNTLIEFIDRYT